MTTAEQELVRLYADHFAGRNSSRIRTDEAKLRASGYVEGPGGRPRINWQGIFFVETHGLDMDEISKVYEMRVRILKEALSLVQESRSERFNVHKLASNLGLSEEQWIPHIIGSPFFDGNGMTIGEFKLTSYGLQSASGML